MTRRLEAKGEEWDVRLSREAPHDGVTAVIFRCASNSSHGWRVVEVPAGEYGSQERVEERPEEELRQLFDRSQPFDYVHDEKALPDAVGDTPTR